MGGELFRHVATVARLRKRQFRKATHSATDSLKDRSATETRTATNSVTDSLEYQTAPRSATETRIATHSVTDSLQDQTTPRSATQTRTATHSVTDSREDRTSPRSATETHTATHSVTDSLEHQTAPHPAPENPLATTSVEDQAISHSTAVGQETRWRPVVANTAQEDGASVSAGEHANGDCYLEYVPRVQCQIQALMDGGNTRPQGTTQGSAPSIPAVLAIGADVTQENVSALLQRPVARGEHHFHKTMITEQAKAPELKQLITFISHGVLPLEEAIARKMALQRYLFTIVEGVLYYVDPKRDNRKRAVVPKHLQKRILEEVHAGPYGAHFSGQRMLSTLVSSWWWERMFSDAFRFAKACPELQLRPE